MTVGSVPEVSQEGAGEGRIDIPDESYNASARRSENKQLLLNLYRPSIALEFRPVSFQAYPDPPPRNPNERLHKAWKTNTTIIEPNPIPKKLRRVRHIRGPN
jgi:hypothetical protein